MRMSTVRARLVAQLTRVFGCNVAAMHTTRCMPSPGCNKAREKTEIFLRTANNDLITNDRETTIRRWLCTKLVVGRGLECDECVAA